MTEWDDGAWTPRTHEELMEHLDQQRREMHQRIEAEWLQTIKKILRRSNISRWGILSINILAGLLPLLKEPSWHYIQIPFNLGIGCYFFYVLTRERRKIIRDETARRLTGKSVLEFHE